MEVFENPRRKGISFPNPQELVALLEKPSAQQPHELVTLLQNMVTGLEKKHLWGT